MLEKLAQRGYVNHTDIIPVLYRPAAFGGFAVLRFDVPPVRFHRCLFCIVEPGSIACRHRHSWNHRILGKEHVMEISTLVIATRNPGKLKEIQTLLLEFPIRLLSLDDFGPIPESPEDGRSFDDNAYQKASFVSRILGLPALADDSGLVVEALDGSPGVHSARFGGVNLTDEDRCRLLLEKMQGQSNRRAAFQCVISIAVPTGAALTYEGGCEGLITTEMKGTGGFGYDPVFFYPPLGKTFAEIAPEEKNSISHRAKALLEVREEFPGIMKWIHQNMPIWETFACQEGCHD